MENGAEFWGGGNSIDSGMEMGGRHWNSPLWEATRTVSDGWGLIWGLNGKDLLHHSARDREGEPLGLGLGEPQGSPGKRLGQDEQKQIGVGQTQVGQQLATY